MKLQTAGLFALAGALCSAPGLAATPVISGSYGYSSDTFCQPTIQVEYAMDHWGQTFVNGLNLTTPESSAQESGLAAFNTSKATVTYKATRDSGDDVLLQTSGGLQGAVISEKPQKGSAGFSNTPTTVTLNGTTFNATYGRAVNGVSGYFALVGLDSAGCSEEWEFTLKK